jgi:hypothetical protein
VGVRLCADEYCEPKIGDKIYFSSKYQIIFYNEKAAIYEVESEGEGLIKEVKKVNKISGFDNTLIYDKKVDIFNRGKLIQEAVCLCNKTITTVAYQGFDEHWTFVHEPDLTCLNKVEIFDISPPDPPSLITILERLNDAGVFGDFSVSFKPRVLDLRQFTEGTIYPCTASGLSSNTLDARDVKLSKKNVLVGCDISREILEQRYNEAKFHHINICPAKTIKPSTTFLAKCCKTGRSGPITLNGQKGFIVHWGASTIDVISAMRYLFDNQKKTEK